MALVPVPFERASVATEDILSGRGVRAITWQDISQITAWVVGRGGQLAAGNSPACLLSAGTAYRTHLKAQPAFASIQRWWLFWIRGNGSASDVTIEVQASGNVFSYAVAKDRADSTPFILVEDVPAQSTAVETLRYDITVGAADVNLDAVSVFEVPRIVLDTETSDLGTSMTPFSAGQPIRHADFANIAAVHATGYHGRRHLFAWGGPWTVDGSLSTAFAWSTTSGVLVDMFPLHPPILARKDTPGTTDRSVQVQIACWVDAGVTAHLYVGTTKRAPAFFATITSTSAGTYTGNQTVDAEDSSTDNGLRDGTFDGLRVQAYIESGAGGIHVVSVNVFEDN